MLETESIDQPKTPIATRIQQPFDPNTTPSRQPGPYLQLKEEGAEEGGSPEPKEEKQQHNNNPPLENSRTAFCGAPIRNDHYSNSKCHVMWGMTKRDHWLALAVLPFFTMLRGAQSSGRLAQPLTKAMGSLRMAVR